VHQGHQVRQDQWEALELPDQMELLVLQVNQEQMEPQEVQVQVGRRACQVVLGFKDLLDLLAQ